MRIGSERLQRILYGVLFSLAALGALAKGLIFAGALGPEGFGIVALAVLCTTFGSYFATAGLLDGLIQVMPRLRSQGACTLGTRSGVVTAVLFLAFLVGCAATVGAIGARVWWDGLEPLVWLGPFLASTVLFNAVLCDLQVRELSTAYAAALLGRSLAPGVVVLLVPDIGVSPVLLLEAGTMLICSAACLGFWGDGLRLRMPDGRQIRSLVRVGSPFTMSHMLHYFAMNLDRWAVQLAGGVVALGIYSFALQLASAGLVGLNMLQVYSAPRLLRSYHSNGDPQQLIGSLRRIAVLVAALFAVGAIPAWFLLPLACKLWFPQYVSAVPLFPWIYVASFALAMNVASTLFVAAGNGRPLAAIQGVVAVVVLAGSTVAILVEAPLVSFAIIFCSARLLVVAAIWVRGTTTLVAGHQGASIPT